MSVFEPKNYAQDDWQKVNRGAKKSSGKGNEMVSITAGYDFAKWFIQLWEDRPSYETEIKQLKKLLEKLYEEGNEEFRSDFVIMVLEHLFQDPEIADYFADWQNEPLLRPACAEAKLLANLRHQRRERDTARSTD